MNYTRQGQMDLYNPYFYTQTIANFSHLLQSDSIKMIIIKSLQYLVKNKFAEIYGYVIMPNHIHLIWRMLKYNGKENVAASFSKYTAHQFGIYLNNNPDLLNTYKSIKNDRKFQFWKQDPLAIPLNNDAILIQKLEYIHYNPVVDKWHLCKYPEDYRWSSANFYLTGFDEFGILKHFMD